MGEILTSTLHDAVLGRLDYLERLAVEGDRRSRAALAETEIPRLTVAWRAVLAEHGPDERTRCPRCSGWFRARPHPCSVWTTAYHYLIGAVSDSAATSSSGRCAPAAGRTTGTAHVTH
jgi:hypothetical protein